jgi:hypothetical protein
MATADPRCIRYYNKIKGINGGAREDRTLDLSLTKDDPDQLFT